MAFGLVEGRIYDWVTSKTTFSLLGITWDGTTLPPVFVALVVAVVLLGFFV